MASIVVSVVNWLWQALLYIVIKLVNYGIDFFNSIISGIASLALIAADMLPSYTVPSPGQLIDNSGFLGILNWLLPISFFLDVLAMMVVAYATYHIVGPVLRWVKLLR